MADGNTTSPKKKLRLGMAPPPVSRIERIARLSRELAEMDADRAIATLGARDVDRPLKTTVSLCPTCLAHVPAIVFERAGRVIMTKRCPEHGASEALIESDARYYALSNKDRVGRRFAEDRIFHIPEFLGAATGCCAPGETCDTGDGTDQSANRTCTILVEVTDACNLACKVCYSESAGDRYLPFAEFQKTILALIAQKGRLDSVQVTGGESTLHPQFWEMIAFLYRQEGVGKIYVPTNGLRLAKEEERAKFAPFADKIMVLLQFDALSRTANQTIRGAEPADLRRKIIESLDALGVPMQLTMTLARGVNDAELGDVVDVALAHDAVKLVALQPVTWSGRYELEMDPMERLTLSDVARAVHERARLRMRREDFVPIPCSHPNCGWITVFLRRFGAVHNIVRYVDMEKAMERVAYKTLMSTSEIREVVGTDDRSVIHKVAGWIGGRLVKSTDMFSIAIKPFMDRYSYDQDRIANCCHHIADTQGRARSFCEYNALDRRSDPWSNFPRIEELQR
ncbi:radical SAM protein [Sandaracinus amylolyticus]|uniref:radical SAM protein n=1 Tax=Sandaracinus amylolyticus TaxID=927083 RepID=UPI001F32A62D|nr:radical SAM protein [Sandaracinus amylolyticus]UJR78366.1 Molybdopterin-based tungsten cofactor biosynthesis protein [Sandaracinus amylolyticus]